MKQGDNKHSNHRGQDPRITLQSKYRHHKLEFIVSKYVETKYINSINKTTKQLFDSVKEFIPENIQFLNIINSEYNRLAEKSKVKRSERRN